MGMIGMEIKFTLAAALLAAGMIGCFGASCAAAETAQTEAAQTETAQQAAIREKRAAALDAIFWKEEAAWYGNEIEFDGYDEWMEDAHLMLASYETEDKSLQNAAFTYDNALAAMAFAPKMMSPG